MISPLFLAIAIAALATGADGAAHTSHPEFNEFPQAKRIAQHRAASVAGSKILDHLKSIRRPGNSQLKSATSTFEDGSLLSTLHSQSTRQTSLAVDSTSTSNKVLGDTEDSKALAGRLRAIHQKAMAIKHVSEKADTPSSEAEEAKNSANALRWLPFVLPPVGLLILGGVAYAVVTIRNWQKIPSMPTHGRMDIETVRASAERAGGYHSELKHPSGPVR